MTQRDKLKEFFESRAGEWVPLYPDIMNLYISQYGRVIHELRTEENMTIENRIQEIDGKKRSWFRYVQFKENKGQLVFV